MNLRFKALRAEAANVQGVDLERSVTDRQWHPFLQRPCRVKCLLLRDANRRTCCNRIQRCRPRCTNHPPCCAVERHWLNSRTGDWSTQSENRRAQTHLGDLSSRELLQDLARDDERWYVEQLSRHCWRERTESGNKNLGPHFVFTAQDSASRLLCVADSFWTARELEKHWNATRVCQPFRLFAAEFAVQHFSARFGMIRRGWNRFLEKFEFPFFFLRRVSRRRQASPRSCFALTASYDLPVDNPRKRREKNVEERLQRGNGNEV